MASLADLKAEDKEKVGNLLRELARSQRDSHQAAAERQDYQARLQKLRSQNAEVINVCGDPSQAACPILAARASLSPPGCRGRS